MSWKIGTCLLLIAVVQGDKAAKATKDPELIKCVADNDAQQDKIKSLKSQIDAASKKLQDKEQELASEKKKCEANKQEPASAKGPTPAGSGKVVLISYEALKTWTFQSWDMVKHWSLTFFHAIVSPANRKMMMDQYDQVQDKRRKLMDDLWLAAQPHVGEHIATATTLYNVHAASHVDLLCAKSWEAGAKVFDIASEAVGKAAGWADDLIKDRAQNFAKVYPSTADYVPDSSIDVMLTIALFSALIVVYIYIAMKAMSLGFSIFRWGLSFVVSIIFLPCLLCCGRRSEEKAKKRKVFTVPAANGKAPSSKNRSKKKD